MANLVIVDDTVETCRMLARLFGRCGHRSTCLYAGEHVLDLLRRSDAFDLVLLDVMMPGMDGFDVLAGIRAAPDPPGMTPVAMYSAISDPAAIERALALGANEWIVKGTPFPLLQKRLDCFLQTSGG